MRVIASAPRDADPAEIYPRFHAAVARAQLNHWLADLAPRSAVLDISGPQARAAEVAAARGHRVLRISDPTLAAALPDDAAADAGDDAADYRAHTADSGDRRLGPAVQADGTGLRFLADGSADAVIAEDRTLSRQLGAEDLVAEIVRVLRPGGRLLACVDSLTRGMSLLAEQHRWPHLIDVLNADVVLIPWPDGAITRCYGAEQLRELFTGGGLAVKSIRPRTVFSPRTVSYLLGRAPSRFSALVEAELRARSDDSVGNQLIASCVKAP